MAGFMYKIGAWINTKADAKAILLKQATEKLAADVKVEAEKTADNVKLEAEKTAGNLKAVTGLIADNIKIESDKSAANLKVLTADIADNVKKESEKNAANLKSLTADIATNIKTEVDKSAAALKSLTADIAVNIKTESDKTAEALKQVTEKKTDELKLYSQKIAEEYKQINAKSIEDLARKVDTVIESAERRSENDKRKGEDTARTLKEYNERIATELANHNLQIDDKLSAKIDEVKQDTLRMLEGLADRSDLVNGNIANIRNDIVQLQEDIIELYSADDIERQRDTNRSELDPGNGRDSLSARKNRKRMELERRNKRRDIKDDEVSQAHPLYGKGRRGGGT
jgi:hypothetical protein